MSVSNRTLISLLPILLMPLMVIRGQAQLPVPGEGQPSAWWYPLGNPEATRNNPVPTTSQQAEDLKIKWRTGRLKNSPVLLVGGIRTEDGKNDQQIVGIEEGTNRVTILTSTGFVDTTLTFEQYFNSAARPRLRLTGLFNTAASTVVPEGKPNAIGVGVEDTLKGFINTPSDLPGGLIVSGEGLLLKKLGLRDSAEIGRVTANSLPASRVVGIYPAAVYTLPAQSNPTAIAVISQPYYQPKYADGRRTDTVMINGMRAYSLESGLFGKYDRVNGLYAIAPDPYPQPPTLTYDTATKTSFIALSLSGYAFPSDSVILVQSPLPGTIRSTTSQRGGIVIASIGPQSLSAKYADTAFLPRGTVRNYFFENFSTDSTRENALIAAEQQPASAIEPVNPKVLFSSLGPQGLPSSQLQNYAGDAPLPYNSGWDVVVADLDGTAPGSDVEPELINDRGDEFLASWRPGGLSPNGTNWLYMFRHNLRPVDGTRTFYYVTRQQLAGSVVAAGDIVIDEHGRQEALVVDGNRLMVLQLKPYSSGEIRIKNEDVRQPFTLLAEFSFDSPIISVAIADLEGDGENDIVACTEQSTYALGKVGANPYPFITEPNPFGRVYCENELISIRWERNVGSEDTEIRAVILGETGAVPLRGDQIDGDSVRFMPLQIPMAPGDYRIVITNTEFPYLTSTSEPFTVVGSSISGFDFPNDVHEIGDVITDTITFKCIDDVSMQRSLGDTLNWEDASETLTELGPDSDSVGFSDVLQCSAVQRCGADSVQRIFYRLVAADDVLGAREVRVRIPQFPFTIDSGRTHHRALTWEAMDFSCSRLTVSLSADDGGTWSDVEGGDVATIAEQLEFIVPDGVFDSILICVRCSDPGVCGYGVQRFYVSRVSAADYVYPNPFDPDAPGTGGGGAEIVYSLKNSANVTITIYDAARSVVRELVKSEMRQQGRNRGDFWDGRNYKDENVANGTYICVISSSNGEQIILPIAIVKRR